ncbi:hypothetical protein IE53DRAFT_369212 [Violaceomyces palustris]|uniref:Uncharacterized protein n=1 Tax=Violaceomyces palustris TaxID=1673888 RepID=A0ACD0NWB2_9BASI|nr:hypothetical protein IE53DRAFT_369212 [Violaceomyces palustris]
MSNNYAPSSRLSVQGSSSSSGALSPNTVGRTSATSPSKISFTSSLGSQSEMAGRSSHHGRPSPRALKMEPDKTAVTMRKARRMPIYIRIVPKDVWLRIHVDMHSTIGSVKDLVLQKVKAPQHDPTLASTFYRDAVHASNQAKIGAAGSYGKSKLKSVPKSFVARSPRPAPLAPGQSVGVSSDHRSQETLSASESTPWSPTKSFSRLRVGRDQFEATEILGGDPGRGGPGKLDPVGLNLTPRGLHSSESKISTGTGKDISSKRRSISSAVKSRTSSHTGSPLASHTDLVAPQSSPSENEWKPRIARPRASFSSLGSVASISKFSSDERASSEIRKHPSERRAESRDSSRLATPRNARFETDTSTPRSFRTSASPSGGTAAGDYVEAAMQTPSRVEKGKGRVLPSELSFPSDLMTGNAEAKRKEAEAIARARSLGWRNEVDVSSSYTSPEGNPDRPSTSSTAASSIKSPASGNMRSLGDDCDSDGNLGVDMSSEDETRRSKLILSNLSEGLDSNLSLADSSSTSSSFDMVTAGGGERLWGTQLEEELLRRQREEQEGKGRAAESLPADETQSGCDDAAIAERRRSKTVTAADRGFLLREPPTKQSDTSDGAISQHSSKVRPLTVSSEATASRVHANTSSSSIHSSSRGLSNPGSREHVSPTNIPVPSSPLSSSAPAKASSVNIRDRDSMRLRSGQATWFEGGRLAGMHIDEMSVWKEAQHGLSRRFSIFSFSNGLLLEDWKTVAAYMLRPFELLELQSSNPTERIHLPRSCDLKKYRATKSNPTGFAQANIDSSYAEAYFEAWVYVFKPGNGASKFVRAGLGTWKLRWLVVKGKTLCVYRKKPRNGEDHSASKSSIWYLGGVKWVVTERSDGATSPPLPSLHSLAPDSLTVAFSANNLHSPVNLGTFSTGQSLTLRCVTQWDHEALYNLLTRAHYQSVSSGSNSTKFSQVEIWRCNAISRALIAGRGGTVQPGRVGRGHGRNAKARARLRPSGWPKEWEDADQWSSSSGEEEALPKGLGLTAGFSNGAIARAAALNSSAETSLMQPPNRGSLDLARSAGSGAISSSEMDPTSASAVPQTPPGSISKRSKLGLVSIGGNRSPASPSGQKVTTTRTAAMAEGSSQKPSSPAHSYPFVNRNRGFSFSRGARIKLVEAARKEESPSLSHYSSKASSEQQLPPSSAPPLPNTQSALGMVQEGSTSPRTAQSTPSPGRRLRSHTISGQTSPNLSPSAPLPSSSPSHPSAPVMEDVKRTLRGASSDLSSKINGSKMTASTNGSDGKNISSLSDPATSSPSSSSSLIGKKSYSIVTPPLPPSSSSSSSISSARGKRMPPPSLWGYSSGITPEDQFKAAMQARGQNLSWANNHERRGSLGKSGGGLGASEKSSNPKEKK